jgi:hypothetical protein
MWIGVTNGLANRKFSGSVKRLGINKTIVMKQKIAVMYPRMSFVE